jgi:hypothetical protein
MLSLPVVLRRCEGNNMRHLTYASESPRLSDSEYAHLVDVAISWSSRGFSDPFRARVMVKDGYELHISYSGDTDQVFVVGRARLHEQMALKRLSTRQRSERGLHGLFYPTATPSRSVLHQAALYFGEVSLVHPGSALLGDRHSQYRYENEIYMTSPRTRTRNPLASS